MISGAESRSCTVSNRLRSRTTCRAWSGLRLDLRVPSSQRDLRERPRKLLIVRPTVRIPELDAHHTVAAGPVDRKRLEEQSVRECDECNVGPLEKRRLQGQRPLRGQPAVDL